MKNSDGLQGVRRFLLVQLGVTALLAAIALLFAGYVGAKSALLGGFVNMIPNAYFASKMFQYQGARAARQILNSFYKGEALKIGLSVLLFALVFVVFNIIPWIFFASYISIQMLIWFAPLIFKK